MASVKASLELADRILYFMDNGDTTIAGFPAGGGGGPDLPTQHHRGSPPPPLFAKKI